MCQMAAIPDYDNKPARVCDSRHAAADLDAAARLTLATDEFIRRFLLHVLPKGFHRIRHYGLLATGGRQANLARARALLAVAPPAAPPETAEPPEPRPPCPCCGGHMVIIETLQRWMAPRGPPAMPAPTGMVTP
jgi:hypothetical protein